MADVNASALTEGRRMQRFAALVGATFFVTSLVGVILGFHELDEASNLKPTALLWSAWLLSAVMSLLIFGLAILGATRGVSATDVRGGCW
jgi:uncharacterized membrane protein